MGATLAAVLGELMRWLHISSVVVLIGGVFYARLAYIPEGPALSPRFRPVVWVTLVTLIGSGIYNFLSKSSYPPDYHIWFGIKMLFVLHIVAALLILTSARPGEAKNLRSMTGIIISGAIVIAISAWLRWISLHPALN
ncbi:MAG TPA: hypothetical protein VKV15_18730 [Bryobacteraceae bacterium]|nr:hypothetical protein [Bryobacteraceae bacterium]